MNLSPFYVLPALFIDASEFEGGFCEFSANLFVGYLKRLRSAQDWECDHGGRRD